MRKCGARSEKTKRKKSLEEYQNEELKNPKKAEEFFKIALEKYWKTHDKKILLDCLRKLVMANYGIGKLAEKTKLARGHLYRVLSPSGNPGTGNPGLDILLSILNALGCDFSVISIKSSGSKNSLKTHSRAAHLPQLH
jgi:DNA-binding phage protein